MVKHLTIKIYGKVQGVNFRASAKNIADSMGVYGMVQNMPDGTLLIEAEAEEENLQKFLKWCQQGPTAANIHKAEFHFGKTINNYRQFEIIL